MGNNSMPVESNAKVPSTHSLPEVMDLEDELPYTPRMGGPVAASKGLGGNAKAAKYVKKRNGRSGRFGEDTIKADCDGDLRRGKLARGRIQASLERGLGDIQGTEPPFDWGRLGERTTVSSDEEARREPPATRPRGTSGRRPRESDDIVSPPHRRRRGLGGEISVVDLANDLPDLGDHILPQGREIRGQGRLKADGKTTPRPGRDNQRSPGRERSYGLGEQILGGAVPRVRRSEEEERRRARGGVRIPGHPRPGVGYIDTSDDDVQISGYRRPGVRHVEDACVPRRSDEYRRDEGSQIPGYQLPGVRCPTDHGRRSLLDTEEDHRQRDRPRGRTTAFSDAEAKREPSVRRRSLDRDRGRQCGSQSCSSGDRSWSIPGGGVEVEQFSGDPITYQRFVYQFREAIEARAPHTHTRLNLLMRLCVGDARLAIQGCIHSPPEEGYRRAWQILHERYGNPKEVARKWQEVLDQYRGPLRQYADLLRGCYEALRGMDALKTMETEAVLNKLVAQLPTRWQVEWDEMVYRAATRDFREIYMLDAVELAERAARWETESHKRRQSTASTYSNNVWQPGVEET